MWRDDAWLLDMLTAAGRAAEHAEGLTRDSFLESRLHQDAIARQLEVLGEAARNVSDEVREEHAEIPWAKVGGMKNRLVHEYFRVDLDVVWSVVTDELPDLMEQLARVVPQPEET